MIAAMSQAPAHMFASPASTARWGGAITATAGAFAGGVGVLSTSQATQSSRATSATPDPTMSLRRHKNTITGRTVFGATEAAMETTEGKTWTVEGGGPVAAGPGWRDGGWA